MAEKSCNQLLIDTAMTLLLINLRTVKSIAMSLYNITHVFAEGMALRYLCLTLPEHALL